MSDFSDPMDCSPPGSSAHGIFQARVLEWGAIAFSIIREMKIRATMRDHLTLIKMAIIKQTNTHTHTHTCTHTENSKD